MSKRNRNFNRGHLINDRRNLSREAEILSKPIGDLVQERVIANFLARIEKASDTEAIQLALALQQFIRGDAALLSNMHDPAVAEVVQKEIALAEKTEAYSRKWEEDREGFIDEMDALREKNSPPPAKRDEVIARGIQVYQSAQEKASAERHTRRLKLEYDLTNGPKEMIHVVGIPETQMVQGAVIQVIQPEIIRIMHKTFVYPPGDHLVPKLVADRYRQILKGRAENAERRKAMRYTSGNSYNTVERKNMEINQEYGSKREALPLMEEG